MVLVWCWCGSAVVLVWRWCGAGVELVWCWCGVGVEGAVVLVLCWCGVGVVLVHPTARHCNATAIPFGVNMLYVITKTYNIKEYL